MQPMQTQTPPAGNPALVGGILMLVCAALILFGTVSRRWMTLGGGDNKVHIGLVGYEICDDDHGCQGKVFDPRSENAKGVIAFTGGIASVALTILAGALALGRNARKIPLIALYIVLGVTLAAMLFYVVKSVADGRGLIKFSPGFSFFLAVLGVVGALVVSLANRGPAARRERGVGMPMQMVYPMQMVQQPNPHLGPMMMQPPMQACPRCTGAMTYVPQYQRYFCTRCQQYA
jgi:hypothetical protein